MENISGIWYPIRKVLRLITQKECNYYITFPLVLEEFHKLVNPDEANHTMHNKTSHTVYLLHRNQLKFMVVQNELLFSILMCDFKELLFLSFEIKR